MSKGALRELMNLFHLSPARSRLAYRRWRNNLEKTHPGAVDNPACTVQRGNHHPTGRTGIHALYHPSTSRSTARLDKGADAKSRRAGKTDTV
ncbi:Uncharacterised protein [Candidatus Venteria ishoeyi]|uniref:Uncharacterized protein n=1 Tax=Candidatus Venteria ishoeyi TaxID=1899563 RepID=A0A1H6FF49_9GAMM|nr:Uncharacterised protein [Candidatus Venteria ishoeyi]